VSYSHKYKTPLKESVLPCLNLKFRGHFELFQNLPQPSSFWNYLLRVIVCCLALQSFMNFRMFYAYIYAF